MGLQAVASSNLVAPTNNLRVLRFLIRYTLGYTYGFQVPILVADCPRCGAQRMTFAAKAANEIATEYGWQRRYEVFAICSDCSASTVFVLAQRTSDASVERFLENSGLMASPDSLTEFMEVKGYVSEKDEAGEPPPEHLPENVETAFNEGAKCLAVGCPNAAGTMFRLAIDLATRAMLPPTTDTSISQKQRRDLGLRLPWLFDNGKLPQTLRDLATAVREDGNDGAHDGTLTDNEANDLLDFARMLLERIYTEPKRIEINKSNRDARRAQRSGNS